MNNETFKIDIEVVVGSKNKQQLSNLTKSVKETSKASGETTQAIDKMNMSLNQLRNMSFSNVVSAISGSSKNINRIGKELKKIKDDFMPNLIYTFKDLRKEGYGVWDSFSQGVKTGIPDIKQIKTHFKELGDTLEKTCVPKLYMFAKLLIVVKGLSSAVRNAISVAAMGDEIKDEAQKVHLSTTAYQEWGYVLEQNGASFGNLKMAMRQFSSNLATGSEALSKYGITSKNIDTAFEQAVFNIQNLSTETEKVAAMTELFGSRASDLMPILNMTNQETVDLMMAYRTLGGTMSDELIARSDKLTDNILAMKKAWQGLKNTLAYQLIPIVNKVVQWLTVAIGTINLFLKALFNIKETFSGSGGNEMGSGLSDNLSTSLDTAKEIKKTLASFDELNILNSNSDSGSVDAGIDIEDYESFNGSGFIDDAVLEKLSKVSGWIEKYKTQIQTLIPIAMVLAGFILMIKGHFIVGAALAGIGLGAVAFNWENYTTVIQTAVGKIKTAFTGAFEIIKTVISGVKTYIEEDFIPGVKSIWTKIKPGVEAIGSGFKTVFNVVIKPILSTFLTILGEWVKSLKGILTGIGTFISGVFTGDWKKAWQGLKDIVKNALDLIVKPISTVKSAFKQLGSDLASLLEPITTKVGTMATNVANKFKTMKSNVATHLKEMKNNISTKIGEIATNVSTKVSGIKTTVATIVSTIGTNLSTKLKGMKTTVSTAIGNIKTTITTNLNKIWTTMKSNISTGFRGVLNKVISMVETAVNSIANKFNSTGLLRGVNKILGTSIALPTISIPRLAKGGVLTAPTVAMLGEYSGASSNPEIAAPQKLLTEIINQGNDQLIDVFVQVGRQMIQAIEKQEMTVQIGDDVIAKSAHRGNQQYKNRTGKPLFGY